MEFLKVLCLIFIISGKLLALPNEPVCSKFDYEMKTLETMLRTEQKVEKTVEDMKAIRETVLKELGELKEFKLQLLHDFNTFRDALENKTEMEQEQRKEDISVLLGKAEERLVLVDNSLEVLNNKTGDPVVTFNVTKPTKSFVNGVPIFSKAITNIGDGYDMHTGVFTSPIDGLYLFIFTVASEGKHIVYCYIYHNDSIVSFGSTHNDNSFTTAAAAVYLVLSKGDKVTLRSCSTSTWKYVYSGNMETTFSGALIKQSLEDD